MIKATVKEVVEKGRQGPYVVTRASSLDDWVTFSLTPEVWREESRPEVEDVVLLSDVRKRARGWRAMQARFFRPEDETEETRKK